MENLTNERRTRRRRPANVPVGLSPALGGSLRETDASIWRRDGLSAIGADSDRLPIRAASRVLGRALKIK